ncbi:MAG: ClpXP protease specificity-enhancing factor SspB [Parvibaculales bacterium]
MAEDNEFNYGERAQNALLGVVRDVLRQTAERGLPGAHHFYISFRTHAEGITLSQKLRDDHPEEMTIVLQNQFEDLQVSEDGFSVRLNFNKDEEYLYIPFIAISKFYDPAVSFGLIFDDSSEDAPQDEKKDEKAPNGVPRGEVISLDNFRDK